jgi:hypothetical protein
VKQIWGFGDDRNKGWCVYCGGPGETRDHVPSRVLLDEPYPPELPVLPACVACNAAFSRDEAYLACLVECALTGSVESAKGRRKVGKILAKSPALATRLAAARCEREGQIGFNPESERVRSIILKLGRGHAAFENNEPRIDEPESILFAPFTAMSETERKRFENGLDGSGGLARWPEVGSRAMTRLLTGYDLGPGGWISVQPGIYRHRVDWSDGFRVWIVMREYLAAEVAWE